MLQDSVLEQDELVLHESPDTVPAFARGAETPVQDVTARKPALPGDPASEAPAPVELPSQPTIPPGIGYVSSRLNAWPSQVTVASRGPGEVIPTNMASLAPGPTTNEVRSTLCAPRNR